MFGALLVGIAKADECDNYASHKMVGMCYGKLAASKNDLSVCSRRKAAQMDCYAIYAAIKKQPQVCDQLSDEWTRDMCYGTVGEYLADPAICDRVKKALDWREERYLQIALQKKDEGLCQKINSSDIRSTCLAEIDPVHNSHLCAQIIDQNQKNSCYAATAISLTVLC